MVSWCVGHLVELAQPEAYDAKYSKWAYADLPIFPMNWQYEVSAGTKKQFGILKKLMAREDVASLVCATDAGRVGYPWSECTKVLTNFRMYESKR